MKFYSNKAFIFILILMIVLVFSFPKTAEAGRAIATIITVIIVVAAVVLQQYWVPMVMMDIGLAAGIGGGVFMATAAFGTAAILGVGTILIGAVACIEGVICPRGGGAAGGGGGAAGSPTLQNQTATPIMNASGTCTTGFTLNYSVTDAYQYGIYRDNNLINQGTLNTIIQPSPYNTSFSYQDNSLAPNITYKYEVRLTDKNGTQYRYPEMTAYTECSPRIVFNGPNIIEYPNPITLSWIAENVTSLIASGDWSGSKEMGTYPYKSESLSKPRGVYTFILSGTGPSGSDSKQVITQVVQVPRCSFTADPTSIILPQASTLSWSCSYADTCSIDQGVGSVSNISGTQEVRPSATTTYILTCDGLDGERAWQSTVNVGFTPRLREVAP